MGDNAEQGTPDRGSRNDKQKPSGAEGKASSVTGGLREKKSVSDSVEQDQGAHRKSTSTKKERKSSIQEDESSRSSGGRRKSVKQDRRKSTAKGSDQRRVSVGANKQGPAGGRSSNVLSNSQRASVKPAPAPQDSNYDYGGKSETVVEVDNADAESIPSRMASKELQDEPKPTPEPRLRASIPQDDNDNWEGSEVLLSPKASIVDSDVPLNESKSIQVDGVKSKKRNTRDSAKASDASLDMAASDGLTNESYSLYALFNDDDHGYETLKRVFQSIQELLVDQMGQGIYVTPIIDEFTGIWEGIEASHESEQKLQKRDRTVSIELSTMMAQSKMLIKLARDDYSLAIKLGSQLEKAWQTVDAGEEVEHSNEEKIENLRQDIFELNRNINSAANIEGQEILRELTSMKEDLEKERDALNTEAVKYRSSLNVMYAKRQELFDRKTGLEEKAKLLDQEYEAQVEATERETARKEKLTLDTEEIREKTMEKLDQIVDLERNLQTAASKIVDTERAVKDQRTVNDNAGREAEFSSNRIEKLRQDFETQQKRVERLTLEAYRQAQELKAKEGEIFNLRMELHRAMRQRSLNMKKVVGLQQAFAALELEREGLKSKIIMLEKELEIAQKKIEEKKRRVEQLDKERSFVNRNLRRAVAVSSEHTNQAKTHEVAVRTLEQALHLYSTEIGQQRSIIYRLEEDRDFYSHEASKLAQQVAFKLNEIKKMDLAILSQKKKISALETQVKKSQQIYELAVYDKDVFERTLRDTLTEIGENQLNLRRMGNQVASLKFQVNQKDEIVHQEALRYDRILKETAFYKKESFRLQRLAEDIQRTSEALEVERSTLGCGKAEMEGELAKNMYYLNMALSREVLFQRKLMEQEKELRSSWERWRVLYSMIRIGATHFRKIMNEIFGTRFQILAHRKMQVGHMGLGRNYTRLRRAVAILENSVAKEKCMLRAVEEQMKHPINVHRWRLLEATDPEAYEMIQKINLLTKRLVTKNSSLQSQSSVLQEKQLIYVETRKALARSPGLETPEEVLYYQHLLRAKQQHLLHLRHEMAASESQTQFYRDEVLVLHNKMMDLKHKYFQMLRTSQICNKARTKSKTSQRGSTAVSRTEIAKFEVPSITTE